MGLAFAPHLEVLRVAGRGLVCLSEGECDVYSGREYAELAERLDGVGDETELLAGVAATEDRDAIARAITHLRRAGVLIEIAGPDGQAADAGWWSSLHVPPARAARLVTAATVSVETIGDVDPVPVIDALRRGGLSVGDGASRLRVVLTDDYLDLRLVEHNERSLGDGTNWLLAQLDSPRILIGPLFSPDEGPCWDCLAQRMWRLRGPEQAARQAAGADRNRRRPPSPMAARGLGPALLATEVTRWLAGARPGFESTVLSFDLQSWEAAQHHVVWRPQCPGCGVPDPPSEWRSTLVSLRRETDTEDPADLRDADPRSTLKRLSHHISPLSGIVASVRRMPGPEHLHVYVAETPAPRIHGDQSGWEHLERQNAAGKGTTDVAAEAGALCEALERYSGGFGGEEPRQPARFEDLGDTAIHPNASMGFSERQYAERERWNGLSYGFRTYVPEPFDPAAKIDWSPCWSLTHGRERLLPTALLYYDAGDDGGRFCIADSNGNAAGNDLEEAILHGLLELVERDHVALWWYNGLRAPMVDLDTVGDPWLERTRAHLAEQGRELWALDLTADLGIPAAVALAATDDGTRVGIGFGAHIDLRRAVIRAATELVQIGLGAPSGGLGTGPDDLTLERYPFLRPEGADIVSAGPAQDVDVVGALRRCQAAVEAAGLELLVLDQTRPDVGVPVVKVLVPGMRHFWTRFGPGRLYEVPVALGRLDQPRDEGELTPRPPSS